MKTGDSDDNWNSDDPLPDGWTVKVKVRPCGKKDKCYFPPSGEGKFYSKLDVARYLNNNTPKSEEKENGINQHSPQNVASEKSGPEGLPPGWTKEIKVTKKGRKIRRDPYYTDPVSGYVFRSMKDALRYLDTGELGKLAIRPKDKSSNNLELEDDEACESDIFISCSSLFDEEWANNGEVLNQNPVSPRELGSIFAEIRMSSNKAGKSPAVAKKQKLEVNSNQSSNLSKVAYDKLVLSPAGTGEVANDKHVLSPAGTGESMPVFEHIYGEESLTNNSSVQENKSSQRKVQRNDPDLKVVATAGGALSSDHIANSGTIKDESKRTSLGKSKKKKDLSLPRRTSKRLSGVPLEPTPELKSTNRACRAAVKQSNDEASPHTEFEEKDAFNTSKSMIRSLDSRNSKHPVNLAAVGKVETENMGSKPESGSISPSGNQAEVEKESNEKLENTIISEDAGKIQTDNINDEKAGLCLDLPLGELCQDPCIAFAIKTLTGMSFDTTDTVQVSTGSNSDFGGSLATSEDHARKEDAQNGVHSQQGCMADQPLNNVVPGEQVEELEISNKDHGKPGSPLNLSFADAWADPCIEFAIKTLTGAIPLDCDVVIQDCSQHKASSSQSRESSGFCLQNVAEIGQSQIFCQQYGIPEGASYNQGALMEPGLRHKNNMNGGYGTSHAPRSEERSKGSQR